MLSTLPRKKAETPTLRKDSRAPTRNQQHKTRYDDALRILEEHSSSDIIFRFHLPDFRCEYLSPSFEKITGYSCEDFFEDPEKILNMLNPESQTFLLSIKGKILSGEIPEEGEFCIETKDGVQKTFLHRSSILFQGKKPVAIEGVLSDVTKTKDMEQKLLESYKHLGVINRQIAILLSIEKMNKEKTDEALYFLSHSAEQLSRSACCGIFQFDEENRSFQLLSCSAQSSLHDVSGVKINEKKLPQVTELIEGQRFFHIEHPQVDLKSFRHFTGQKLECIYFLPVIQRRKLIGAVSIGFNKKKNIAPEEMEFYEFFTAQVGHTLAEMQGETKK